MEDKIIKLLEDCKIDEIKILLNKDLDALVKLSPDLKLVKNVISNVNKSLELILDDLQGALKNNKNLEDELEFKTDEFEDLEDTLDDLKRDFDNLESENEDLKDKQIGSISTNLYDDQKIEILQELYIKCNLNTLEKILNEYK